MKHKVCKNNFSFYATIRSRAYAFGHQLLKLMFTEYNMECKVLIMDNSCKCTVSLCVKLQFVQG